MQATKYIWQNGTIIKWEDAKTHVLSHALHYGSGVYEGIRVYKGAIKSAIFCLNEHVERLLSSAKALDFNLPYSHKEIFNAIKVTIELNGLTEGYIRPLIYSGYNQLGISAKNNPIEMIIACWPWPKYHAHNSLDVKLSSYIRIHPKSTKVDAKISGHYVNSLMAILEIKNTHYHEVLLLDDKGYISEASSANIFIVKSGTIYTPKLGTILPGITRDVIIKIAKDMQYKVIETNLVVDDLLNADEAFFTGTAVEVTSIRSLDDSIIGKENIYPITEILKNRYLSVVKGDVIEYKNLITNVNPILIDDFNVAKNIFAEQMLSLS
jgi:branched-chain amino acid aminotransferase